MQRRVSDKRRGTALIFSALCCLAVVPILGLAIDGAHLYLMRNQLSTALNAAVLAGTRSLNVGDTVAAQSAAAQAIANSVFNANVAGMNVSMGGGAPTAAFTVAENNITHVRSVSGTATVGLPLMIMGMMTGSNSTPVTLTSRAVRRDVNVILVLDNSGSMQGTPLTALQADANAFVATFANNRDNMGLVTFGGAPYVAQTPVQNFVTPITAAINTMQAPGSSTNNAGAAMWAAYQQLVTLNEPGALNVIVIFTDGVPGSFAGNFGGFITDPAYGCSQTLRPLNGLVFTDSFQITPSGISSYVAQSVNDTPEVFPAAGCNGIWLYPGNPGGFVSNMPSLDINGNSTNGTGTIRAYQMVDLTSLDSADISYAAQNAFDDAANRIRSDANLVPMIFAIGLTTPNGTPPDAILMSRIANDPGSAYYNSNQPAGIYVAAPTTSQLQTAFASIAAQVLQLARN